MKLSSLEFAQMQMRCDAARRSKPRTGGEPAVAAIESESELHADIQAECRRRGWLALHGSMAHKAKRTAGEPDFVIITDGFGQSSVYSSHETILFVECKSRLGKLSTAQQALHAHARKLGVTVHVIRSFAEFLKLT